MSPKNKYKFTVQPEYFERPKSMEFLKRIDSVMNLHGIARRMKTIKTASTFISRMNRGTALTTNADQIAFAEELGEICNEIFWELGVGLGHFPPDPHKKYKFFYLNEHEQLKDRLEQIEENQKMDK